MNQIYNTTKLYIEDFMQNTSRMIHFEPFCNNMFQEIFRIRSRGQTITIVIGFMDGIWSFPLRTELRGP